MKIISLSLNNHDSSFTVIDDGKIIDHILGERFTGIKKSKIILPIFERYIENSKDTYDFLIVDTFFGADKQLLKDLQIFFKKFDNIKQVEVFGCNHHILHAYAAFYSSMFDDALCFVFDGNGPKISTPNADSLISETESIFLFKNKKFNKTLYKKYILFDAIGGRDILNSLKGNDETHGKNKNISFENSIGIKYGILSLEMGFDWHSAGKVMGLGQYKNHKEKLQYPYNMWEWRERVDQSYDLQVECNDKMCKLIGEQVEKNNIKNIILTGGVSLNCISTFNCVKHFPNLNFHVDPICSDKEISLGSCLFSYYKKTKKIPDRIKNSYIGYYEKEKINYEKFDYVNVEYEDVVNLLLEKNIISMFQGRSEVGERALGNRSLLFDPRVKNGSNIVNRIKKRENFRPFAATVLLDKVDDWFDIGNLNECKYMSYAVDAKQKSIKHVPAVIHANNTSRIQTVTEQQNYHFYHLIYKFYEKTGVPMLLNTSFNLAGKPLVETFDQAIYTLRNSEIEYLYLPEEKVLIKIKNVN